LTFKGFALLFVLSVIIPKESDPAMIEQKKSVNLEVSILPPGPN